MADDTEQDSCSSCRLLQQEISRLSEDIDRKQRELSDVADKLCRVQSLYERGTQYIEELHAQVRVLNGQVSELEKSRSRGDVATASVGVQTTTDSPLAGGATEVPMDEQKPTDSVRPTASEADGEREAGDAPGELGDSATSDWLPRTDAVEEGEIVPTERPSVAETLREAAEVAQTQTGYVYDASTGLYYDRTSGYYYDAEKGLHYEPYSGTYYYFDSERGTYEFHSRADLTQYSKEAFQRYYQNVSGHKLPKPRTARSDKASRVGTDLKRKTEIERDSKHRKKHKREKGDKKDKKHSKYKRHRDKKDAPSDVREASPNRKSSERRSPDRNSPEQSFPDRNSPEQSFQERNSPGQSSPEQGEVKSSESGEIMDGDGESIGELGAESWSDGDTRRSHNSKTLPTSPRLKSSSTHRHHKKQKKSHRSRGEARHKSENSRGSRERAPSLDPVDEGGTSDLVDSRTSASGGEVMEVWSESESQGSDGVNADMAARHFPPCIRAIVTASDVLDAGSLYILTYTGATLGREPELQHTVHIPDTQVSKMHCEIRYNEDLRRYEVKDCASQNGTQVNGHRLSEPKVLSVPYPLAHRDTLTLGGTTLELHIHAGTQTCDGCEPGLVRDRLGNSNEEQSQTTSVSAVNKEKLRRSQLKQIKQKYGLANSAYVDDEAAVNNPAYQNKAEVRRRMVGSDNPYRLDDAPASVHRAIPTENKGRRLLAKMGWKEGEGLGKSQPGITEPIQASVRARPSAGLGSSAGCAASLDRPDTRATERWLKAQDRYSRLQEAPGGKPAAFLPGGTETFREDTGHSEGAQPVAMATQLQNTDTCPNSDTLPPGDTRSDSVPPGHNPPGDTRSDSVPPGHNPPGGTRSDSVPPGHNPPGDTRSDSVPPGHNPPGDTRSDSVPPGHNPPGDTRSDSVPPGHNPPGKIVIRHTWHRKPTEDKKLVTTDARVSFAFAVEESSEEEDQSKDS